MILRKTIFIQTILIVTLFSSSYASRLLNYGFEDWNGNIGNTPQYIISSAYQEYATEHANATEVVSSYNEWTPHSGSYMLLQNDGGDFQMSPSVSGISSGDVNAHNNIGYNGRYGGSNNLQLVNAIQTGIIFIRFWARHNRGFSTIDGGGRCKWIRIQTNGGIYDTVYMHLGTSSTNPPMFFYCGNEGGWLGGSTTLPNAYNGNWHKYSMYVNWNTGVIRAWYDVNTETASNATKEWVAGDGRIGAGTRPEYFLVQANFSAKSPTELTYHAIDDVEVWDDMPNTPTDNDPSISIDTPTTQTTYETDLNTLTFQGTASDDNGLASISWSYGAAQQGNISSDLSNWSTGAITLEEGTNQFTVTVTDSAGNTANDTVNVTYNPGGGGVEKQSPTGLQFGIVDNQHTLTPTS